MLIDVKSIIIYTEPGKLHFHQKILTSKSRATTLARQAAKTKFDIILLKLDYNLTNVKKLETNVYNLLADKTNKDAKWWKDQMKSDFYIPADDLVEYGVIDQII